MNQPIISCDQEIEKNVGRHSSIISPIRADVSCTIQLGVKHHQAGDLNSAESIYRQILVDHPDDANTLHLLGLIAFVRGDHAIAIDLINKAIHQNSSISGFHYNIGNVFKSMNKLQDAADSFKEALRLDSQNLDALNNLGNVLRAQGKVEDALQIFRSLLELKPDSEDAHSNFLLTLIYHSGIEPAQLYHEHIRWDKQHKNLLRAKTKTRTTDNSPDRRLRVGYVSPDLRQHSVAYFIEAVLEAHDRSLFDIICYSNVSQPDPTTHRLRALSDNWRDICQMTDDQVAELIRKDKIDILIDLAGHTANNRLLLFTLKPAPVQVTYLGYPNTTGLSSMDYRLTDVWADPYGETDHYYTEKLIRLPHGFLCFKPPKETPATGNLPALTNESVTFGSFNNIAKISPKTAELWSAILKSIPQARLILKSRALNDSTTCRRIEQLFIQNGVSADRIKTVGYIPSLSDHLALYNEIDIALDPFPYNGTTTTCQALWMGVPVITLAGNTHASRVGVSLLSCIGMTDLIAETPKIYRDKAVQLSADISRLQKIRVKLRTLMLNSNLTNGKRFTRSLEQAYRQIWKYRCQNSYSISPCTEGRISFISNTNTSQINLPVEEKNAPPLQNRDSKPEETNTNKPPGTSIRDDLKALIDQVYDKRLKRENLSFSDLMLMLADTILDQSFFQSEYWKWRYGGVRYFPCDVHSISDPKKILVMQWPSAIGDAAMALHFYAGLRDRYPGAEIYLFGNHLNQSIYEQSGLIDIFVNNPLDSFLDQVLSGNGVDIRCLIDEITKLVKHLASEEFDLLLNLQILPMTAVLAKLTCAKQTFGMTLADDGMPIILGNIKYPYLFGISSDLMRSYNIMHRSELLKRLVESRSNNSANPASFITQESLDRVQRFFDISKIKDKDILIGISPMASFPSKTWNKYDKLIQELWKKYGAKMILFGSSDESDEISRIIKKSGGHAVQATHFSINELMAAISGCDLIITNDTGPMHLACLMKRKVIALFGPTIIREVGPWNTDYIALQSNQCKECFQATCDIQPSCMDHISVSDVLSAIDYFINNEESSKEKLSSRVYWYSPEDRNKYSDKVDEIISFKYSKFFSGQTTCEVDVNRCQTELEIIRHFCREFELKVKKAIGNLKTGRNVADAIETDRAISENCDFFKGIVMLNDMKFLDKRRTIGDDIESYRMYYNGILRDIEYFMES